ncbi:MAG: exonuclease SbcCD subunit D [Chloroflexi bacterium]|nr:exonuclease SbcCD subunit D [Chloroflexota bacterium]
MRFLHSADWHVGRTMRGRSRAAEFEQVLAEVVGIARAEGVDALLVTGDVWDSQTPSPEADRLVYDALRQCIDGGVQVVLLAGNHDSPRKLEGLGRLSELLGVQTQAKLLRPDGGGVLTLEGRAGETARIAAVPWVAEGRLVDAAAVMELQEQWFASYADGVARIYAAMCAGFDAGTVNLLLGHVFIDGARVATVDGSERLVHIGQTYALPAQRLPAAAQYVALGHVHEPQELGGAPVPAAYAGSLLQLDFGERGQQKLVRLVEASPGRPAAQRAIALRSGRALVEVRGTLDAVLAEAERAGDAHLRVVLDVERPEPGLAARVREQLPSAVDVRLDYPLAEETEVIGIAQLQPEELFARYYLQQHGAAPAVELLALFRELHEQVLVDEAALAAEPVA